MIFRRVAIHVRRKCRSSSVYCATPPEIHAVFFASCAHLARESAQGLAAKRRAGGGISRNIRTHPKNRRCHFRRRGIRMLSCDEPIPRLRYHRTHNRNYRRGSRLQLKAPRRQRFLFLGNRYSSAPFGKMQQLRRKVGIKAAASARSPFPGLRAPKSRRCTGQIVKKCCR